MEKEFIVESILAFNREYDLLTQLLDEIVTEKSYQE